MNVELTKEYRFEAAHFLPRVPAGPQVRARPWPQLQGRRCHRGAGESGDRLADRLRRIDDAWAVLFARFDHHNLNEVAGLENSTCENIAIYVWRELRAQIKELSAVTVWETYDSKCTYRGG